MRIPDIQSELRTLSTRHGMPRLAELADLMKRRSPRVVAPQSSVKMPPEIKKGIKAYRATNPNATQLEIGNHFGVNPGRVSETLRGKKK